MQSLEGGADDYIEKPFRARELIARLRAVLRRRAHTERYTCRGLEVDLRTMQASLNGVPLELTAQEYRLLRIFLTHAGQVLERGQLLQLLWDQGGNYVNDNTLTVTVKRLREKLEPRVQGKDLPPMQERPELPVREKPAPPDKPFITTVRGVGYRWEGEVHAKP